MASIADKIKAALSRGEAKTGDGREGPEDTPALLTLVGRHVVGFTGAFGSGCTTAVKQVRDEFGFAPLMLSDEVRKEWRARNPYKTGDAPRVELQQVGDQLREQYGGAVLVERALAGLKEPLPNSIVIDGIRNVSEIAFLRRQFGFDFTLIAVLADVNDRWARISDKYTDTGLKQIDFHEDDRRDQDEDTKHGQQVNLCVDQSDVFLANTPPMTQADFRKKVSGLIKLLTGIDKRPPHPDEVLMHMAFSSAHGSQCLKRHVGAIVTDGLGQVVGVGYNENPLGTKPCVHEEKYEYRCFRDRIREEHFTLLTAKGANCPACGTALPLMEQPPWLCPECKANGKKTNLETFFFPDRAMWWCTAIHAEARALMAAGERARGGVVYTTTFPCFQCSEKIKEAGVSCVVFTDSYPDQFSEERLRLQGIELKRFEGVRSSSFERIFKLAK